jgi:FkbM family methyltransferase
MSMSPTRRVPARVPRTLPNGWIVEEMTRSETDYLYTEIVVDRLYDLPGIDDLSGGFVVDVGANIGLFALQAASRWGPESIMCIEAIPDVRQVLRHNVAANVAQFSTPIDVVVPDVAAGAKTGWTEFVFYPDYSMMSGRLADPAADLALVREYAAGQLNEDDEEAWADLDAVLSSRFGLELRRVEVAPLSELCASVGRPVIDLLKVDVEGDELTVLDGLGDLRVRNAVVEVDSRHSSPLEVRARLEALGMDVVAQTQDGYEASPLSVLTGVMRR